MGDENNQRVNKNKLSLVPKKLTRFLSIKKHKKCSSWNETLLFKSTEPDSQGKATPKGCFSVYVGSERQRFVIKTEKANHPLFRMLLDDAELEYGFNCEGPLRIPCEVDLFCKIMVEMENCKALNQISCGFLSPFSGSTFNPKSRLGQTCDMAKGCSPYEHLTPPRSWSLDQAHLISGLRRTITHYHSCLEGHPGPSIDMHPHFRMIPLEDFDYYSVCNDPVTPKNPDCTELNLSKGCSALNEESSKSTKPAIAFIDNGRKVQPCQNLFSRLFNGWLIVSNEKILHRGYIEQEQQQAECRGTVADPDHASRRGSGRKKIGRETINTIQNKHNMTIHRVFLGVIFLASRRLAPTSFTRKPALHDQLGRILLVKLGGTNSGEARRRATAAALGGGGRQVGRNKFRRSKAAGDGGGVRRRRRLLGEEGDLMMDLDRPTGPGPTDEHSVHPHHRDFNITPIANRIGPIDSVSKTEYYDLKNHFESPIM
ncbi:hypothetical protein F511_22393 [Dorcoceras hygrometricum]|uniref:Uncharacterized protein n=1 Tax=Dorcoceras hygrometricum TaxID=472368 RepID=A0A2Z7B5L1_9LAMI|nr:hypothetical protein F511_22393 [Dorcoceras hygrometricum]